MNDAHVDDLHGDVSVDQLQLSEELLGVSGTASQDVAEYAMRLGDDALILAQQLGWWISRAPELSRRLRQARDARRCVPSQRPTVGRVGGRGVGFGPSAWVPWSVTRK